MMLPRNRSHCLGESPSEGGLLRAWLRRAAGTVGPFAEGTMATAASGASDTAPGLSSGGISVAVEGSATIGAAAPTDS